MVYLLVISFFGASMPELCEKLIGHDLRFMKPSCSEVGRALVLLGFPGCNVVVVEPPEISFRLQEKCTANE